MSLVNKPLESITEADLQSLVDNSVAEGKTVEYKSKLPDGSDSEKKEFLYDVSAFANAAGGLLIYGIDEDKGIATRVGGLEIADIDAAILRLENAIRDGIAPRLPGLATRAVPLGNGRVVLILKVPKSWALPHMVTFKGASKFYSRDSRGKYQLDVDQIRSSILLSETAVERIRNFRRERLSAIVAGELPTPLQKGAKLVLHIIPITAFDLASQFDVISSDSFPQPLTQSLAVSRRINFDGLLSFNYLGNEEPSSSYLQTFRNGVMEAVDTNYLIKHDGKSLIHPDYESCVVRELPRLLVHLGKLGVQPPLLLMLSFLGVKGYLMAIRRSGFGGFGGAHIDRDALIINEILVENFEVDLAKAMKPTFDAVWNAAGLPRSLGYDDDGNWLS